VVRGAAWGSYMVRRGGTKEDRGRARLVGAWMVRGRGLQSFACKFPCQLAPTASSNRRARPRCFKGKGGDCVRVDPCTRKPGPSWAALGAPCIQAPSACTQPLPYHAKRTLALTPTAGPCFSAALEAPLPTLRLPLRWRPWASACTRPLAKHAACSSAAMQTGERVAALEWRRVCFWHGWQEGRGRGRGRGGTHHCAHCRPVVACAGHHLAWPHCTPGVERACLGQITQATIWHKAQGLLCRFLS